MPITATAYESEAQAQRGFTLIELMVTISVAVIVLAIAVPSLRVFTARNQVAAVQSSFIASLAFARAEAARRGTAVFVVAASGGVAGNEYANGWDVYADVDGNGAYSSSADTPSLRHYEALPTGVVVGGSSSVTFTSSGYLSPAAAMAFKVCQAVDNTQGMLVTLPPSGIADVSAFSVANPSDCTSGA